MRRFLIPDARENHTNPVQKIVHRLEFHPVCECEERLISAIGDENPEALGDFPKRFGINAKQFYIAVANGANCAEHIFPDKVRIRIRKGLFCFFLDSPLSPKQANEALQKHQLNGLGYLTSPTSAETLPADLRTAIFMAMHRFITGECRAVCLCGTEDGITLSRIQKAISRQDDLRLIRILRDMQYELPDISAGCAFRMNNMLCNYCLDFSHGLYAYDLNHLLSMYGNIREMLMQLIRLIETHTAPTETAFESENAHFRQIIRYIHRHYADDLSLRTLADLLHITPGYVSRLFSRESGTTYRKYLTKVRIERAVHLLSATDFSIAEICNQVGFKDYFHFLKTFKRFTGVTPGKYAKSRQV